MFLSEVLSGEEKNEKSKVGRPPTISSEEYRKKFLEYQKEVFVKDGIADWNSSVYKRIAKDLKLKSKDSYKTVYLAAKRFAKNNGLDIPEQCERSDCDNSDDQDHIATDGEYTVFDDNFKILPDDISYEIDIKDVGLFNYSDSAMKLQSEWSDTLNEIIWNFARLPCAWCFDKHRKVANEKIVFGTCRSKQCKAKLFAFTENGLTKLRIVIKNFNHDAIHTKKRALKNSNKEKVSALLKQNKASFVHAELADEMMESYDYCPAHLPNKATLRKLKQRERDKTLRDPDPIRSLCIMKTEAKFHRSITDIGIDPFYCFFSTPEQKEWLRLSTRFKKCVISVDSTGAPVRPPQFSSLSSKTGNLKPVFLYIISLQVDGINRPIFQVLSQRHTSDFISYFLKYWRHHYNGQKNPHQIVMDNSSALILASVLSFTSYQTKVAYMNACYDKLFHKTESTITCFIRLDRSHIVKEILRMKVIAQQESRVKKLLQRVLGYLITVKDVQIAEEVISNIFVLILNKYEHIEEVSTAKWELKTISDHHEIDDITDDENDDENNYAHENIVSEEESKFKNWIKDMITVVRENYVDDALNDSIDIKSQKELDLVENVYYIKDENGTFERCLIDFLSTIPLWSNIMMDSFSSKNKTATSSPTEAEFKNVKCVIFQNEKGIRVDSFVEKYLCYLLGQFKFSLAENKNQQDKLARVEEDIDDSQNSIIEVSQEIWRNKNVDILKPKKVVRSGRCKNSILEKAKPFTAHIPILPNGGTSTGNNRKPTIIAYNTCPFDVLFQIFAAFYKDIPQMTKKIDESESLFDRFIKDSFTMKNSNELLAHRNQLLCSIFPKKVTSSAKNMKTIDLFMCMNEMIRVIASNSSIVYSMKTQNACERCNSFDSKRTHTFIPMRFKGDWKDIIENLQEYVAINERFCNECSSRLESELELNDVVVINIGDAYPDDSVYLIQKENITKYILLNDEKYIFRAAIQYASSHFMAHIVRNNGSWETYDGIKNTKIQRTPRSFYSVQYFYVEMEF